MFWQREFWKHNSFLSFQMAQRAAALIMLIVTNFLLPIDSMELPYLYSCQLYQKSLSTFPLLLHTQVLTSFHLLTKKTSSILYFLPLS
jgi:hypothetical protein